MLRDFCVNAWNRFTTSFALAARTGGGSKIYLNRSSRKSSFGAVPLFSFFFLSISLEYVRVMWVEEPQLRKCFLQIVCNQFCKVFKLLIQWGGASLLEPVLALGSQLRWYKMSFRAQRLEKPWTKPGSSVVSWLLLQYPNPGFCSEVPQRWSMT